MTTLDEIAARAVISAWTDPGVEPAYQEYMKDNLRRDWPVLARALDRLTVGKM